MPSRSSRRLALALLLLALPAAIAAMPALDLTCAVADPDGSEPPCNPHLAQGPWSASHRASYAQASSPLPGPTAADVGTIDVDRTGMGAVPIVLTFSEPYEDGRQVVWGSTVGFTNEVFKLDADSMRIIDKYIPQVEEQAGPGTVSPSGAYNILDADGNLVVAQAQSLQVFADSIAGDAESPISKLVDLPLPPDAQCRPGEDELVGITMTHSGHVVFATKLGVVGSVPRQPDRMTPEHLQVLSLNGDACTDDAIATEDLEAVSNSIAADEEGGVYVVTDQLMHRIDLDPRDGSLSMGWSSDYPTGDGGGIRLGDGSGSTPSLMGTGAEDEFVVITDGQDLMHLTLLWRDAVPEDWEPLTNEVTGEQLDPRVACHVPIRFGDPEATESASEQSVLVRGQSAVVVNNAQPYEDAFAQVPPRMQPLLPLVSGVPTNEPRGMERVDWDPETRTCSSTWANPDVAIPNGIPTMSAETGLFYGVGSRDGVWTLEAVDYATGEEQFHVDLGPFPGQNSFYAATTIGPGGEIWTGTFGGVIRLRPGGTGAALSPAELVYTDPTRAATTGDPTDITSEHLGVSPAD